MDVGLLLLRLVVGGLFIGHGSQKLFGSFGGHGLEGTGSFMGKLGYRPGRPMAALAGFAELASGALLLLGFFTPFAAAGIIGVMFNAIISVHWRNGVWNQDGGIEYPLVLCTVAAAVTFAGPGAYSVDGVLGLELAGVAWGVSAILLGVITGSIVAMSRRPAPVAQQEAEERRRAA
ncbi:MAG: DoxX family protein [Actinomycetota bacterium]